jgi:hypothetical protein
MARRQDSGEVLALRLAFGYGMCRIHPFYGYHEHCRAICRFVLAVSGKEELGLYKIAK